ncbi:MAG TPA: hypothetical protein VEL29_07125 [Gemmatimonadales bacterium]|nr:hypothetical protein [Gemmatimonadales bacterium]
MRRRAYLIGSGLGVSAVGTFLSGLALAGCGLFGPAAEQFLIRVDSIAAPSFLAASDTLTARFYGGIGPDGCWALARVDKQMTPASLDVTFQGEHQVRSGYDCTASPVALHHAEAVAPPLGTPFTITVHQPDGSLLRRFVSVQ